LGVYRAQIWAVAPDGTASGIVGNVAIENVDDAAWCGVVDRSVAFPAKHCPGPVYVWIDQRSAAAEIVVEAGDGTVLLYGLGSFE
jgi:hypothetical protein